MNQHTMPVLTFEVYIAPDSSVVPPTGVGEHHANPRALLGHVGPHEGNRSNPHVPDHVDDHVFATDVPMKLT
jgi:hypothetical protein